jgi:hypothetical protein
MIIYFAGAEQNHHCLKLQEANVRNILCSYYHDSFRNHQAKPSRKFKRVFLDSGAFSSYTKNTVIDIDNYIRYIKDNDDNLELYSCLDVIGDWRIRNTWRRINLILYGVFIFQQGRQSLIRYWRI